MRMRPTMRDERALRGANRLAAGMYLRACALLGVMAVIKLLLAAGGRFSWHQLLQEAAALAAGASVVLVQRIRFGLWGDMDDALQEMLHSARAKGFSAMCKVSVAAMLLSFVLDTPNRPLYQITGLTMVLMRGHLHSRCVKEGWLHGLVRRPRTGAAMVTEMLLVVIFMAGGVLGIGWLMEKESPAVWEVVFVVVLSALAAASCVRGARREYRESEAVDDWAVRVADREEKHEA